MEVFLFGVSMLYNRPEGNALVFAAAGEALGHTPIARIGSYFYYVALITDDAFRQELLMGGTPLNRDFSAIASFLSEPDPEDIDALKASLQAIVLYPSIDYPREILRVIEERYRQHF